MGIELHETLRISSKNNTVIAPGMVFYLVRACVRSLRACMRVLREAERRRGAVLGGAVEPTQ